MESVNLKEIFEVWDRVRTWDPEMRIDLARRILETVVSSRIQPPPQTMSLDEVVGIAKTDAPPRTDEDCKKILEEERLKKYANTCLSLHSRRKQNRQLCI